VDAPPSAFLKSGTFLTGTRRRARITYMQAPAFVKLTGMPRSRFDALCSCVTFSEQAGDADDSEGSRWQLIDQLVSSIHTDRAACVSPSELIYVDESMCKWYGQGGHWIQRGLPMYVAIDRKPEIGCEVRNAPCGPKGVMLNLSVVTTAEHRQGTMTGDDEDLPHGTTVRKKLVAPWAGNYRVVCAESYFASVTAAEQLHGIGLRCIGVAKTATRGLPMSALCVLPLEERGEHVLETHKTADGVADMIAILWVDRKRR